jgi:putative methyltransferase (TIGR04325 family)
VAGYKRAFSDLASAQAVVKRYDALGHDCEVNASTLRDDMARLRPGDYPVLFHLARLSLEGSRVFDLGGTSGNLFYLYDRALDFPKSLRWTVHDLPGHMERGRDLVRRLCESRLRFTDDVQGASGHDVLLVSGSLHYFDFQLHDYVAGLAQRPRHVIINRTPLVEPPTAACIQYVSGVMVACRLLNRRELIDGMVRLGYRLIDSWRVAEFAIKLPFDPEYWVREYGGLYFRTGDGGPESGADGLSRTPGSGGAHRPC